MSTVSLCGFLMPISSVDLQCQLTHQLTVFSLYRRCRELATCNHGQEELVECELDREEGELEATGAAE